MKTNTKMRVTKSALLNFLQNIEIIEDEPEYKVCWNIGEGYIRHNKQFYDYRCPKCNKATCTTLEPEKFTIPGIGHDYCGYCGNHNIVKNFN